MPLPAPARMPWWGLVSSAAAPVLLIGGWTVAAARQPASFDPVVNTISDLAANDAQDRWLMTTALAGLGVCHVVTALAVRDSARAGRAVLGVGGVATVLVAVYPLPAGDGGSAEHTTAAGIAFAALAAWPFLAGRRAAPWLPPLVRLPQSVAAGLVLVGLVGWFAVELRADADRVGLAERFAAGAQALWPFAVVWSSRWWRRR